MAQRGLVLGLDASSTWADAPKLPRFWCRVGRIEFRRAGTGQGVVACDDGHGLVVCSE